MIITTIETQKKNKERKSVYIDGKYSFGIDEEDCFKLNLYEGQVLDSDKIVNIVKSMNISKSKKIALRYILFKMRTESEVKSKLNEQGYDDEVIDEVITNLKELGYINDSIYVEKFIKDAVNIKNQGINRIRYELQLRGINNSEVEDKLQALDYDEEIKLKPLIERKIKTYKDIDDKTINKIKTYFIRKGYSHKLVNNLINQHISKDIL